MTRKSAIVAGLAAFFIGSGAWAQYQQAKFGSTANPVGSGGRAMAWGSAFIAVADDATAASWNPGGLTQLVLPEASVALSYHTRMEGLDFAGLSVDSQSQSRSAANLNYASVVYPFHVGEVNMVASLNFQRLYEFDRDLSYTARYVNSSTLENYVESWRLEQLGALTTVTPAYCIQILPQWSVGLAVNFWGVEDSGNGWDQQWQKKTVITRPADGVVTGRNWSETREKYELSGVNFVVGTHYKLQNWTFAAVYKSGWEADLDYTADYEYAMIDTFNPATNSHNVLRRTESQKLVWPESYGVGVAYRYSDRLSLAVDTYMTRWSNYVLRTDGREINLVAGFDNRHAAVKDSWQVHAGAEYLWVLPKYVLALRGGAFLDPEPVADGQNDFYGLALGGGIVYRNFIVDAAVQYRWANNVKSERVENVVAEADVQEYMGMVSLIYHFE
ncbi:MAG TPA: outer membrane protein transport protein [bacterium]|nr:outer membrane protein transport protein [bacterium]